jgi:RNA-directed DNA polymerase
MGETSPTQWDWVERSVWTEAMLKALEKGVKGGVWFSLIDKVYRPGTLYAAWLTVKANKGKAGSDRQSIEDFESNL